MITNKSLIEICNTLQNQVIDTNLKQRGIGDLLEGQVLQIAEAHENYIEPTGIKSTGDFGYIIDCKEILVDVKTNNINATMSMPNLISMKKLLHILEQNDDLYYMFIGYSVLDNNLTIEHKNIISIYDLDIDALTVGALGNGQLQIKNYLKSYNSLYKKQTKESFKKDIQLLYMQFVKKQIKKWTKMETILNK